MSFQNVYMHRRVAETTSKPCEICYKPSTSVLVTSENKVTEIRAQSSQSSKSSHQLITDTLQDFFYVCASHLKDKGFCSPVIDEAAVAAKKKKELEAEIERVKQEFEEKQKKKKEMEKEKEKEKDKNKGNDKKEDDAKKDEKKAEEKVRPFTPKSKC
jgi:ATP-dependent Clp protease ATP-binding subunit ClpA